MKISQLVRLVFLTVSFLSAAKTAWSYVPEETAWPKSSTVVIQLGLGSTARSLQDGSGSWNASAADAAAIWNGYCDFISFSTVSSPTVPEQAGDSVNSAFFSNTVFGDSFGSDTLAATVIQIGVGQITLETTETDVVVNTAYAYDSYRGPQQPGLYDLHRIMLHEFGHVLGLDHVVFNPPGQAIMEPEISDFDHLGADDVAGIRSLYGATFSFLPSSISLRVGDSYSSDPYNTNNDATSYSASGLPPGLTINSSSGQITGTTTVEGNYGPVITAHGPIADAYGTYPIKVLGLDLIRGLLSIIHTRSASIVPDPIRPRMYLNGNDRIEMVDTATYATTQLAPSVHGTGFMVSVSADGSTLLYTDTNGPSLEHRIDLESLTSLPDIPIPANGSIILEGLDNRAYVGGTNSGLSFVDQFDATTGALELTFASFGSHFAPQMVISPDRKTLCVVAPFLTMATYDISTDTPVLINQLTGDFSYPTISPDGQYLYAVGVENGSLQAARMDFPGLTSETAFSSESFYGGIAVSPDGTIYLTYDSDDFLTSTLAIYDPASLQLKEEITPDPFNSEFVGYVFNNGAFDHTGQKFFVSVAGYYSETWVFSADRDSLPPATMPGSKDLLNISTRARVEAGEDAMIGGFIVQGSNPKKVVIRGIGPSLPLTGALSDPVVDVYDSTSTLITSNDDWTTNRTAILGTQVAPSSPREAAILRTLDPGAYTAVVHDKTGQPGTGLIEVYDLTPDESLLANISTRGKVTTGDNVMIGGFIIGGTEPTEVVARAIGPSLAGKGIAFPLADPLLELHDATGAIIASNDNWRSTQQSEIIATGLAPTDDRESAIVQTLDPGNYTAIVRGQNGAIGVALVEVYNVGHSDSNK